MGKKRRQALGEAQLAAEVRYGPQEQELRAALRAVGVNLKNDIGLEHSARRTIQAANREQIPKVRESYRSADRTRDAAQERLAADFGTLGSAAAPFAAAAAVERAGAKARSAESRAGAVTEFRHRITDAASGEARNISQLRTEAKAERQNQHAKLENLLGLKGAFTIQEADKIVRELQKMALTRRGQNLSHQDRVAALRQQARENQKSRRTTRRGQDLAHRDRVRAAKAAKKAKKSKGSYLPKASASKVHAGIGYAAGWFAKLDGHVSRHKVYDLLRTGGRGKIGGQTVSVKAVDPLFVNAGADLHYRGYVSRPNLAALKRLGFKVPREWRGGPYSSTTGSGR